MRLTDADVERYRALYANKFGVELGVDDARKQLALLVRQVQIFFRPLPTVKTAKHENEDSSHELKSE